MVKEIRIYFEGAKFLRPALGDFLSDVRQQATKKQIQWNIIASGSRGRAFDDFRAALNNHPDAFNLLLVDAEAPVVHTPWEHLRRRQLDQWPQPDADDSHCHLMVQMMEAWFVADVQALKDYYKQGFNENAVPGTSDVEKIAKDQIEIALKEATRKTSKGKYHKTRHAPAILSLLNVDKVRQAAPHCDRLFKTLHEIIEPSSPPTPEDPPHRADRT